MASSPSPTLPNLSSSLAEYFRSSPPSRIALFGVSALLLIISLSLATWHITRHIRQGLWERRYTVFFPRPRRRVVAQVLWVQVTVVVNFLTLLFPRMAALFTFVGRSYQAWALFAFMNLLTEFGGGKLGVVDISLSGKKKKIYGVPPFGCCFRPCLRKTQLTPRKLMLARFGVLQACAVQPLLAFIALFLQMHNLYVPGSFRGDRGFVYIIALTLFSTLTSMYFVSVIHESVGDKIATFHVRRKFLLVKILIPLFVLQSLLIALIYQFTAGEEKIFTGQPNPAVLYESFVVMIEAIPLTLFSIYAYPVQNDLDFSHLERKEMATQVSSSDFLYGDEEEEVVAVEIQRPMTESGVEDLNEVEVFRTSEV